MANVTVLNTDASLSSKTLVNAEDAQTISGVKTFSNGLVLATSTAVHPNTSDGADNQVVYLSGGGAIGPTRGAYIYTAGNESSAPGFCAIGLGNVAGASFVIDDGSGQRLLEILGDSDLVHLPAGKLKFPATQAASTDVNVLDDYEEGTWTPTITGSGGTSGQSYSLQNGQYVKIGKVVFVQGRVALTNKGTMADTIQISGLPFAAGNTGGAVHSGVLVFGYWGSTNTNFINLHALPVDTTTNATIYCNIAATQGLTSTVTADYSNTTDFLFSGSYIASA